MKKIVGFVLSLMLVINVLAGINFNNVLAADFDAADISYFTTTVPAEDAEAAREIAEETEIQDETQIEQSPVEDISEADSKEEENRSEDQTDAETEDGIIAEDKDPENQIDKKQYVTLERKCVLNPEWPAISYEDIYASVEAVEKEVAKVNEIKCDKFDEKIISANIADEMMTRTRRIALLFLLNKEEWEELDKDVLATGLVDHAVEIGDEIDPRLCLRTQFYGYSYEYSAEIDETNVLVQLDYAFIDWMSLVHNGQRLYSEVMSSLSTNGLAAAAWNEYEICCGENHAQDSSKYNIWCWGVDNGWGWCGAFVGYCTDVAGLIADGVAPPAPDCGDPPVYSYWYEDRYPAAGEIYTRSEYYGYHTSIYSTTPQPGDIFIVDDGNSRDYDHVGIVIDYSSDGGVITVEGNIHDPKRVDTRQLSLYDNGFPIVKIIRPYATGSSNNVRVNFNANGGNVSPTLKYVPYAGTYGNLPTPTREGYIFDGWYTEHGTAPITSNVQVVIDEEHTLYAHWTPVSVTVRYYAYGELEGYNNFYEDQYRFTDVYTYGVPNQRLRSNSFASTGFMATGWSSVGNSWLSPMYSLGNDVWDSWILQHAGETIKLVQTYAVATVTVNYYGYGAGYFDSYQGTETYTYGAGVQRFWSTSYANPGYVATGWNVDGNSWGTPTYNLGGLINDSWIAANAGRTINVVQTYQTASTTYTVTVKDYEIWGGSLLNSRTFQINSGNSISRLYPSGPNNFTDYVGVNIGSYTTSPPQNSVRIYGNWTVYRMWR